MEKGRRGRERGGERVMALSRRSHPSVVMIGGPDKEQSGQGPADRPGGLNERVSRLDKL